MAHRKIWASRAWTGAESQLLSLKIRRTIYFCIKILFLCLFWFIYYIFFFKCTSWVHRNKRYMFGYALRNKGKRGFLYCLNFHIQSFIYEAVTQVCLSQLPSLVASPKMGRQQERAVGKWEGQGGMAQACWGPEPGLQHHLVTTEQQAAWRRLLCQVHAKKEALAHIEWRRQWPCPFCPSDLVPFPVSCWASLKHGWRYKDWFALLSFSLHGLSHKAGP